MIVELCGLPGAGKSTVFRNAISLDYIQQIDVKHKVEILYYFFLFFLQHPILIFTTFLSAITTSESMSIFWNSFFVRHAKYGKALTVVGSGIKIIDEGPSQNLLSFAKAITNNKIPKALNRLPDRGTILWMVTDEQERQDRMEHREQSASFQKVLRTSEKEQAMLRVNKNLIEQVNSNKNMVVAHSTEQALSYLKDMYGNKS